LGVLPSTISVFLSVKYFLKQFPYVNFQRTKIRKVAIRNKILDFGFSSSKGTDFLEQFLAADCRGIPKGLFFKGEKEFLRAALF
jgi:hypothetical protein